VLAAELVRRGITEVAILADATPYGEAGKSDLEKALAAKGVRITGIERFPIGATNLREPLQRLRAGKPQALLAWGIGPEMAAIARDRVAIGWNTPLLGGWTFSMANFIDGAGTAGEGALMTQTFIQEGGLSGKNAFLLAYHASTGEKRIASPMSAAQGYDGMLLLAVAIREARSTEGPKIRAALENLTGLVQGAVTTYERPFTSQDHEAITSNMLVVGVVRDGRVTYAHAKDAQRGMLIRTKSGGNTP
jgi:branched-chain amino acid transport system substrate-binding protein